jgi:hypothetical protein
MRVLHDRLVSEEDRSYLTHTLHEMLTTRFDVRATHEDLFERNTIMFGELTSASHVQTVC